MPARYHRLPQVHDVFAYTFALATGVGAPLTFNPFTMRCTRAFTLPNITRILSFAEMVRTTSCVARSRITSWFSSVTQNRWLWDRTEQERMVAPTRYDATDLSAYFTWPDSSNWVYSSHMSPNPTVTAHTPTRSFSHCTNWNSFPFLYHALLT